MPAPETADWFRYALAVCVLCVAVGSGGYALRAVWSGRSRRAVVAAIVLGLLVRAYAGSKSYLHPWDERYHALVARNLVDAPLAPRLYPQPVLPYDYRDWQANHIWLHKPPLSLWLMAASIAALGRNEIAVRTPSILLSTASLVLTWAIGRRLVGRRAAALAVLLQAANPMLVSLATGQKSVDHVDTLLVFVIELTVWIGVRLGPRCAWTSWLGAGFCTGLGLLTKSIPALLACPTLFLLWGPSRLSRMGGRAGRFVRSGAAVAGAVAIGLLVAAPWESWTAARFPRESEYERGYNRQHVWEPVEGHAGGPLFYVARLHRFAGELYLPALVWSAWLAMRRGGSRRLGLLAWWLAPLVAFSLVATKRENYIAPCMPAILLAISQIAVLVGRRARRGRWRGRPYATAGFLLLTLIPLKDGLTFVNPFRIAARRAEWAEQLKRDLPPIEGPQTVVFNSKHPIEAMFYADVIAYPQIPDEQTVRWLAQRGYSVYVFGGDEVPADLPESGQVKMLPAAYD